MTSILRVGVEWISVAGYMEVYAWVARFLCFLGLGKGVPY